MAKPKRKCCHSAPLRCSNCPVVAMRKQELKALGMHGKALRRAVAAARATQSA